MTRGRSRALRLFAAAAALVAAVVGVSRPSGAQTPAGPLEVLDVPYLPQSESLCGGAAAAMVMRYWGARGVRAEAFSALVERAAGGIRTGALASALEQRGWTVAAGAMDRGRVADELSRGRPVIALIEDRPSRFHYVVIVSWPAPGKVEGAAAAGARDRVIVHDPARAPLRVLDSPRFERAWEKADRWALVALPPAALEKPAVPADGDERPPPPACAASMAAAVTLAQQNDRARAREMLARAAGECPADGAPWRELAGVDILDERWTDAAAHAEEAIARQPRDLHAWRILATARYLQHDDAGALVAWNRAGEPHVDIVDVRGLERTRYGVAADAMAIPPDSLLTPPRLRRAARRLAEVPAVAGGRVAFHPLQSGRAQVDAAVIERSAAPTSPLAWAAIGLHAATERELVATFASLSGGGESIDVAWRWWEHRPRTAASFAAPAPARLGGAWRVDVFRETQTFGSAAARSIETRTSAALTVSDWALAGLRWQTGLALDRWSPRGGAAAVSGAVQFRPADDRVSIDARVAHWFATTPAFSAASLTGSWRSSGRAQATVWLARGGFQMATDDAPASVWPGADTGHARDVLLRAHPLLTDGVITGGVFGRRLAFGGAEWRRWCELKGKPVRIAPAMFVDAARAIRGLPGSSSSAQLDAGAGLRLAVPGTGVLRLDLAHGLRDGRTVLSVGWMN